MHAAGEIVVTSEAAVPFVKWDQAESEVSVQKPAWVKCEAQAGDVDNEVPMQELKQFCYINTQFRPQNEEEIVFISIFYLSFKATREAFIFKRSPFARFWNVS